ncbi:MAG: AAA family ATPase, partial [Verrucomicrobiota bacterium]
FADPTTLVFDRGVTAVVGPNGCGKSNVLDAIRWVLGEQSAKALRGGSMQDVIFSGSDSRKPLGMAEVALNFAECEDSLGTEYHEVRVARRVFRDGHGEYEINKTPCRLRDIHRLFMDTGIGRSAYSIMEQGRIDQILSSKPEERRAVFEEAAGITRFKSQKKEALRKLEATESNLLRVTDIVKEVERQIGSLQRQANKARRYKEMFERLKLLDTHLAAHEFGVMKEELESGQARVDELQMEFNNLQTNLDEKDHLLKSKRRELEELNNRLQQLEQEKSVLDNKISSGRQQIEFNQNRIQELDGLKERNRLSIVSINEKFGVQKEQEQLVNTELSEINGELSRIQEVLAQHEGTLESAKSDVSENQQQRNESNTKLGAIDEQLNQLRQEKTTIEARRTAQSERLTELEKERPVVAERLKEAQANVKGLESKLADNQKSLDRIVKDLAEAETNVSTYKEKVTSADRLLSESQSEHDRVEMKMKAVQDVISSRQGFSKSTREILESQKDKGVVGALVDYLRVDSGYGEAIRVCLGAAWEAVLVDRPESIPKILKSLEGQGAAFAYNKHVSRSWFKLFERTPANCALNFVKANKPVESLIRQLLKSYLIAENDSEAEKLSKQFPAFHIVSKQGEVWYREGWQQRGQRNTEGNSFLEYENQFQSMKSKLPGLKSKAEEAKDRLSKSQHSLEAAESTLSSLQKDRKSSESLNRDLEL